MYRKKALEFFFIATGSFILSMGINMFLLPCQFSSGGVSAIGTVLLYLFKIPLSLTNLFFNAVLFIFGYKYIGKSSVIKTIMGILFFSLSLEITKFFPVFNEDYFIATVVGGFVAGVGIGLVIRNDASTGGSDFAALILKKFFPHIPVAVFILIIDGVIIIFSGIVFKSYIVTFYSAIAMFIASKVTDAITTIGDAAKSVYIISDKNDKISDMVINTFRRGVTGIYSKGLYSGKENMMLLCAVSPKQLPRLVNSIREIDRKAFIIVSNAHEVLGEGFKNR